MYRTSDGFVRFLLDRAGDQLRVVADYDTDDYEVRHVRPDIDVFELRERLDVIHANLANRRITGSGVLAEELGEHLVTLQVREDGVVIDFPWDGEAGTVVSLEPEAARRFTTFVDDCIEHWSAAADPEN